MKYKPFPLFRSTFFMKLWGGEVFQRCEIFLMLSSGVSINSNKTIGDEGITVDFRFIKVHTSN